MTEEASCKYGVIYRLTSPIGKVYIGKTINVENRWKQYKSLNCSSQPKIYKALLEFGPDNFLFEVIDYAEDENDLIKKERQLIRKYNSVKEGYNGNYGQNNNKIRNYNKNINGVDYITSLNACKILNIKPSFLKRMRYDGKVGYYKLNERCILYQLSDIEDIIRSKQIPRMESNMAIVQTNDGNLMFNGVLFLRELTVATKLGVTLENLRRLPNTRNIIGPDGQRYYNKQDIDRIFVEGKAKIDKNKKIIKG